MASPLFLAAAIAWLASARPPGGWAWLAAFAVVAAAGVLIPGAANQVTLSRAYLAVPAFVYALRPATFALLAVTVALAGLTDLVDGTVARRLGRPTAFGGGLDPVVDGLCFGAAAAGLAAGGGYPWWLAAVVMGRYGLPALAGGALLLAGRRPRLVHTLFGQLSTVLIAGLLGWLALWRGLGLDGGPLVAAAEVIVPAATVLTFANLAWSARSPGAAAAETPG